MPYLHSIKLERQTFAFLKVGEIIGNNELNASNYKSRVESMGMMIHHNGLVSTLSILKNAKSDEDKLIYKHLAQWVHQKEVIGFTFNLQPDDLLTKILAITDSRVLLALTIEALALTDVMKEILKAEVYD